MADAKAEFLVKIVDKASEELLLVNKRLEEMEKNAKALDKMRQGALVMGGAMAVGLGLAVAQAIKFESALAPVKTVLTGTSADVEAASGRIGKQAMEWSGQYSHSSEEFLKASYNMLSAGLNEVQALAGTQQSLLLSTATMGDAVTASALLGTAYNNFGNKANNANVEMTRLSDSMAKTQQVFQIANLGQLNEGLANAAKTAPAFRVSFEQVSTVVGQLNTLGITGSNAGTAFNAMMVRLSDGADKLGYTIARNTDGSTNLIETIANIKAVGASNDDLIGVFGQEAAVGVLRLTEKLEDLRGNYESVKDSGGATAKAAAYLEKTFASQSKVLGNNMNNLGVTLGNVLLPALAAVLRVVNPLVRGFGQLLANNKPLAQIIMFTSVALTAVLIGFGSYVFWIKTAAIWNGLFTKGLFTMVGGFLRAGAAAVAAGLKMFTGLMIAQIPIGWIMLGILALIAVFAVVVAKFNQIGIYWDNFRFSMQDNKFLKPLLDTLNWIINLFRGIFKWVAELFGLAGKKIEMPAIDIANSQQQIEGTLPAQKAVSGSKIKGRKGSGETDWGLNAEFLAANGLGGGVKPSAKTIDTVRAGVQNVTHNKGGAVDNSRSIHIANVTIDGANITDFETFKLELSAAVGGLA